MYGYCLVQEKSRKIILKQQKLSGKQNFSPRDFQGRQPSLMKSTWFQFKFTNTIHSFWAFSAPAADFRFFSKFQRYISFHCICTENSFTISYLNSSIDNNQEFMEVFQKLPPETSSLTVLLTAVSKSAESKFISN